MYRIVLFLACALSMDGAIYYVSLEGDNSYTGTASNFVSGTTGPWRNLWKAADVVSAGDTVYVRGGNYGVDYYDPNGRAGTAASPIVLTNYPGETPIIAGVNGGATYALDLKYGANYHKVYGLTITNCGRTARIQSSTHCEIAYCTFGPAIQDAPSTVSQLVVFGGSQSNWIHHCTMFGGGYFTNNVWEGGHVIEVGAQVSSPEFTYNNSYNLIESNHFYWGGHDVVTIASPRNILRYNHIHNENWQQYSNQTGLWGERCIEIGGSNCFGNLIEGNIIGYSGQTESGNGGSSVVESPYNIFRRNRFIRGAQHGFQFYTKYYGAASSNYFYNNTVFDNGNGCASNISRSTWTIHNGTAANAEPYKGALFFNAATNNIFKNNIFRNNSGNRYYVPTGGTNWMAGYVEGLNPGITNSYHDNIDPLFVNADGIDPFATNAPDLNLQSTSPMIDAGEWLTTITSASGSGNSFTVADANYLWGGWMVKDTIQLQGESTARTVESVDYETKTLTLSESVTWTNGQGISIAYVGAAPDMGAYEYGVGKTNPIITWLSWPSTYPQAVAETNLNATFTWAEEAVAGTATYSITNDQVLPSGHQTVTVTFTPTDTNTFNSVSLSITITNAQADPGFSWSQPVDWYYPLLLSEVQLNATASQAGTFDYNPPLGTKLNPGQRLLTTTFTPSNTNYLTIVSNHTVSVMISHGRNQNWSSTQPPNGIGTW